MKAAIFILALVLCGMPSAVMSADESPIVSQAIAADNSPAVIAAAGERGTATAKKDIQAGTFRILYYGLPWSLGKPLVDDATGYRVQVVEGCCVSEPFSAEVQAYNRVMTEWHDQHK